MGDDGGEEDIDREREGDRDGEGGTRSAGSGRSSSEKLFRRNLKGMLDGRWAALNVANAVLIASSAGGDGRAERVRAGGDDGG